jgi:phosphate transport system substrate-binding protein
MRRLLLLAALLLPACGKGGIAGPAPHQIHIAGSSAAFPFSTAAAERLMREQPDILAPLVRAGGSGAGIDAFCGGLGLRFPDIVIATRRATAAETARCRRNGIGHIAQVMIGRTAFLIVSARAAPRAMPPITRAQLYKALAGPALRWSDIDPHLPPEPIRIHGPAPAPAIADGVYDLLLAPGCTSAREADCSRPALRKDGAYVGHGSDAELIAAAVASDPGSIGILPYAQARAHADTLNAIPLDGVAPTPDAIAAQRYAAAAPLILLAKRNEAPAVPGLPILLSYYAQDLQPGGAFAAKGLIPPNRPTAAAQRLDGIGKADARL